MSVVFKYKHPCSYEYAPGYVNIGIDGEQGKQGSSGNAMYFTDFELDNSYDIELALQKIENNYILSNDSVIQLKGRKYKVNDIILSNSGNCYKLVKSSTKSLFKNYKFDIKFLGKIHKSSFNRSSNVVAYDFTDSKIYDMDGKLIREFPSHTYSPVPTNRVNDNFYTKFFDISKDNENNMNKYFSLYGAWIKFVVFSDPGDTSYYDKENSRLNGVKYSLEIQMKNRKTLQGVSGPIDSDNSSLNENNDPVGVSKDAVFESNIPIEFTNICTCSNEVNPNEYDGTESEVDANTQTILSELISQDINKPLHLPSYISDYSMDMLHPSGNNIKCTLNHDKSMWFKSGKGHWPGSNQVHAGYNTYVRTEDEKSGKYVETFPKNKDPNFVYDDPMNKHHKNTVCEDSFSFYDNMHTVNITPPAFIDDKPINEQWLQLIIEGYNEYAAGLGVSALNTNDIQKLLTSGEIYGKDCNFIIASNNEKDHAGESMFFSAKPESEVVNSIMSYLFNVDNKFILTSKDHRTKEFITSEISVSVDNTFKNADIYVSLTDNVVTGLKIVKHQ